MPGRWCSRGRSLISPPGRTGCHPSLQHFQLPRADRGRGWRQLQIIRRDPQRLLQPAIVRPARRRELGDGNRDQSFQCLIKRHGCCRAAGAARALRHDTTLIFPTTTVSPSTRITAPWMIAVASFLGDLKRATSVRSRSTTITVYEGRQRLRSSDDPPSQSYERG
jgi:hypothetical protein